MNTYYIDYTIPEQNGSIKIEANDAEEAGKLFQKYSTAKLYDLAEGVEGPVMEAMREYTGEQIATWLTNDLGAVEGKDIDVTLLEAY